MIESRETVIDGVRYRVSQLGARHALRLLTTLAKVLGPGLGKGLDSVLQAKGGGKLAELLEADTSKLQLGPAVEALVDRLDEPTVEAVVNQLADATVLVLGDKAPQLSAVFDAHFAGKLGQMFKWLAFALEVQFGDFFGALGSLAQRGSPRVSTSPGPALQQ